MSLPSALHEQAANFAEDEFARNERILESRDRGVEPGTAALGTAAPIEPTNTGMFMRT